MLGHFRRWVLRGAGVVPLPEGHRVVALVQAPVPTQAESSSIAKGHSMRFVVPTPRAFWALLSPSSGLNARTHTHTPPYLARRPQAHRSGIAGGCLSGGARLFCLQAPDPLSAQQRSGGDGARFRQPPGLAGARAQETFWHCCVSGCGRLVQLHEKEAKTGGLPLFVRGLSCNALCAR